MPILHHTLRLALLALLCSAVHAQPTDSPEHADQPLAPPNIVWIVAEDMSPWLGCYGDGTVPTPNLDQLAARGTRFTNAFATSPVCAPARSTLITGHYATAIGSMHMRTGNPSKAALKRNPGAYADVPSYEATPPDGLGGPNGVRCFPELLRANGYYTTNRAKQDYQFKVPATVWDASSGKAHWINRAEGNDGPQPFFAVFNLGVTHESGTFPDRNPQPVVADPATVEIPPYYPDTPTVRADLARTYDNIAAMDKQVGKLLDELEAAGLLESTYVFFYSDHGVGLPRGKRTVYDSGTRVPLIVSGPGIEAGAISDRLVSFIDFAPTVLSLAGIEPSEHLPGRAFLGAHTAEPNDWVYLHADRMDSVLDRTRAITDGRYKLIWNLMPDRPRVYPVAYAENIPMTADLHALRDSGESTPEQWQVVELTKPDLEFYDTAADPHEVNNLSNSMSHTSGAFRQVTAMLMALEQWKLSTNDLGLIDETEMVRTILWPGGKQPSSGTLTVSQDPVRIGASPITHVTLTITAADPAASLGYRLNDDAVWHVYAGPTTIPVNTTVHVVAHRIGHTPSRVSATYTVTPN